MYVFITLSLLIGLVTLESARNLIALGASVCITIGAFHPNRSRLRLWILAGTLQWLALNIIVGSPAAALLEAAFALNNLIGYIRFRKDQTLPR